MTLVLSGTRPPTRGHVTMTVVTIVCVCDLFSHSVVSNSLWPMYCSTPGFLVHHQLLEFAQTHVHWVSDAIQPSCPLSSFLLLPSVFSSIRVFSSKSALYQYSWPEYWSFSFSISPSNKYSGLISFMIGLISLLSKGLSESTPAPQFESINSLALRPLYGPTLRSVRDCWKNHSFDCMDLRQKTDLCFLICCLDLS